MLWFLEGLDGARVCRLQKIKVLNFIQDLFFVGAEGVEPPTTLYHLTCCFLDPNIRSDQCYLQKRSQILNTTKICKLYEKSQISEEIYQYIGIGLKILSVSLIKLIIVIHQNSISSIIADHKPYSFLLNKFKSTHKSLL